MTKEEVSSVINDHTAYLNEQAWKSKCLLNSALKGTRGLWPHRPAAAREMLVLTNECWPSEVEVLWFLNLWIWFRIRNSNRLHPWNWFQMAIFWPKLPAFCQKSINLGEHIAIWSWLQVWGRFQKIHPILEKAENPIPDPESQPES